MDYRIEKTKRSIYNAFIELRARKPLEKLTVKELCEKYLLSPQKAELLVRVTQNEQLVMNKADDLSCSLYISIPFCPSRCNYCSFISCAGEKILKLIPEYLDKLIAEIKATAELISSIGLRLSCVYVGGGTPTVLNEEQLVWLENVLKEYKDETVYLFFHSLFDLVNIAKFRIVDPNKHLY